MKIIRHLTSQGPDYAVERNSELFPIEGDIFGKFTVSNTAVSAGKRLAPIVATNIIGIGLNYRKHAEETGKGLPQKPMWFMKTTAAVQNPGDPIVLPSTAGSEKVDYEGELAVIIGKACKNVRKEDALPYVLGYTIANDVSARDWQYEWGGGQFCQGKSFDTFCPLGPCLVTADELTQANSLQLKTTLNGQVMQDWSTSDMVFDIPTLIAFLSQSRTLPAGTVILTGTPQGVGTARKPPVYLHAGDQIEIEIERIGQLRNPVISEK